MINSPLLRKEKNMNGNNVLWRVILTLVLIAAVIGLAALTFQAGVTTGIAQKVQVPANGTSPVPYYGAPFFWPPIWFGGFGIFGVLIGLFIFFAIFRMIRVLIWGPRWGHWGHWHHHGPWGIHFDDPEAWNKGVPPPIAEWHRRMHEQPESEKKE
jgi:hypothetical protein